MPNEFRQVSVGDRSSMPSVNTLISDFEIVQLQLVSAIADERLAEVEQLDHKVARQFDHLISINPYSGGDRDQLITFILDYLLPSSEQSPMRLKAKNKVAQLSQLQL